MALKENSASKFFLNLTLFIFAFILQYSCALSFKIAGANPMIILSLLIAVSMFGSELSAFFAGFVAGVFTDGVSSTMFGFNSIMFMLLAFFIAITVHYLFNNNIRTCLALSVMSSILYFSMRWLFFDLKISNIHGSLVHLFKYSLTSAIYTAVLVIPFYYIEKFISRRR